MAASSLLILLITLLSLSASPALATSVTLLKAAKVLSNSGFLSMALKLQLVSHSLEFESPTATIFAPPDLAFIRLGQPSLPLLLYHVSPRRLSLNTLKYLRPNTKIPTLLPNYTLTLTGSPNFQGYLSINNLTIDPNAVLDDGSVVIYGIDEFFNSSFLVDASSTPAPPLMSSVSGAQSPSPGPSANEDTEFELRRPGPESFRFVADLLRSKGYSIMAAFLDAQLVSFKRKTRLTIFAPVDEAIEDYQRNTTDYSLIFRQHVVPRMLLWQDLVGLDDGTMLPTFEEGFMINVIKFGEVPALNEVAVVSEDMYQNRWLVVHGLNRLLTSQEPKQQDPVDDIYTDAYVAQSVPHHDYGDFH
ncbi:PREDICTED: putative fasciclin-like arabinogalactan protein 20 [Prunus mume]|uniref:Fasciclin-like arabinogalactan protein 20 n=1 Tax=Prunus mume TaxID=102107 RepID=A0ABM0NXB5_PRUMU|nr:PREDICTED: putative fasciclin-like arabinogalactan protein 20 [Prunus mume]